MQRTPVFANKRPSHGGGLAHHPRTSPAYNNYIHKTTIPDSVYVLYGKLPKSPYHRHAGGQKQPLNCKKIPKYQLKQGLSQGGKKVCPPRAGWSFLKGNRGRTIWAPLRCFIGSGRTSAANALLAALRSDLLRGVVSLPRGWDGKDPHGFVDTTNTPHHPHYC